MPSAFQLMLLSLMPVLARSVFIIGIILLPERRYPFTSIPISCLSLTVTNLPNVLVAMFSRNEARVGDVAPRVPLLILRIFASPLTSFEIGLTAFAIVEASVGAVVSSNITPIADTRFNNVVTGFSKNLSSNATIGLTIPTNTSSRYGLLLSANFSGVSTVMPVFTAIVLRTG